jgi:outer membrane lipoprotein SlyB
VETASDEDAIASDETPPPENVGASDEKRLREEEATGAVTGGIVGGVLGAAVALLIPVIGPAFAGGILVAVFSAALGAVTGGFLGAFVTMGVPEEQARHYEEEFTAGRTIVTVKTDDDQQKALNIMYHNGARYANAHDRS